MVNKFILFTLFGILGFTAFAQPNNTTSIDCNLPDSFTLGAGGYTGCAATNASLNDFDCNGTGDVGFSVENSVWFDFCNNTGATITMDFTVFEVNNNCNVQGAVFVGTSSSNAVGNGLQDQYTSNPGGAANGFTITATIPDGECAYIVVDGYAGATCSALTINADCPCLPPVVSASGSPTTICPGATSTLAASGATTYAWNNGAGTGSSVDVAPTSTTTYTVTGTTDGCDAVATVTITVAVPELPDAGPDLTGCDGDVFTIGADPIYNNEGSDYSWDNGAGSGTLDFSGGGQDNGTAVVSPSTTTTYTVTIIDINGCTGIDDMTIAITLPVTPTFDPITPVCQNDPNPTLATTSLNGFTGTWAPAINTATLGTTTYTFTPTAGQCATTATLDVFISPIPTATISGNNGPICAGEDAVFTVTGTVGAVVNYNINGTAGTVTLTGGTTDLTVVTASADQTLTLELVDDGTCFDPLIELVIVTVNPTPTIFVAGNIPTSCNGTDGTLDVTGSSTGTVSLEWSGTATGTQSTTLPFSITGLASGTYDVFYTDDASSCVSATEQVVLNNPGAPIINGIIPYTSCAIDYILPTITGSTLTGGQTYYDAPGGPGGGGTVFAEGAIITSSMTLYAYDANGVCSAEVILTITINPLPLVIAFNAGPFCEDEVITLDETGAAATSWTWSSDGAATITNLTDQAPVITNAVNGETFTVTATDANNCVNTAQTTVVINPLPTVSITANNGPLCEGENATFTLTGTDGADVSYTLNGTPATAILTAGTATITATAATVDQVLLLQSITDGTCAATLIETLAIIVNPAPIQTLAGFDPSTCNGTDGTIDVMGSSTNSVTISWSGTAAGTNTAPLPYTITGLASGTYDVFYTDDVTGCFSAPVQIVLNNPGAPIIDPITAFISCAIDYIVPAITGTNLTGNQAIYDAPGGPAGGGSLVMTGTVISASTTLYAYDENGACASDVIINITINPLPNSGNNGATIFCPTDTPSDLTGQLVGTFDVGGTWTPVFNSGNNFFDPAIDPAGTYAYTVINSCGTSTTDVIVTITANPNAGTNGNTTLCDTDPSVDLFGLLGGTPNTGGVWSPALPSGSGVYNPAVDAGGSYTYSITTSCGTFSSIVDVTLNVSDDATFSYSAGVYCLNAANPLASINGTNGGVFTISSGGVINNTNGAIDIAGSGAGTFGITYSTSGPCPDVFVLTVTILDVIDPTITIVGPFCSYDVPVILQASQSGGVWSGTGVNPVTGEFNPSLAVYGLNDITYTINGSCIAFSTIQIEVIPAPIVSTIADTTILNGASVNLITTGNASAYSWTPGATLICDDCQNPIATPDITTTYTVSVEENGCVASDQVTITIDYEIIIYVPNAFTPNGDGKNDIFFPIISGIDTDEYKLLIFNRWGELIFETSHPSEGWDGTYKGLMSQQDVYVWKIYCKEVSTIQNHQYIGHVTLIK